VAFSTSGALLKRASPDSEERGHASLVLEAEEDVKAWCNRQGVAWTILRPTMIYGAGMDKNISLIAAFIRKYRFFPITGAGEGSRQPVHAEDLAKACVQIMSSETATGRTYCLGGGEVLSYRAMVCRVFEALGIRPRFLQIPNVVIRGGIAALRWLPRYSYLSPEMANRMNQHMVCDTSAASRDFGYAPRPFRPIEQELVATARLRR
jgi:nucleoside-diphosphate-sugar epimerase